MSKHTDFLRYLRLAGADPEIIDLNDPHRRSPSSMRPRLERSPPMPVEPDPTVQNFGEPWRAPYMGGIVLHREQMDRAIACVNACAGIADPASELARLRQTVETLTAENARLIDASSKAADETARLGEFHTCGAWLWSSLDRERPEFQEAEWRREEAARISSEMWSVVGPMIPTEEDK